jgi:hypothetical protein
MMRRSSKGSIEDRLEVFYAEGQAEPMSYLSCYDDEYVKQDGYFSRRSFSMLKNGAL